MRGRAEADKTPPRPRGYKTEKEVEDASVLSR